MKLESKSLIVKTQALGAELTSIVDKHDGQEFLWQGDPSIWAGRAPLLFPHCGRLKDDVLIAHNKQYDSPVHGFARHALFCCTYSAPHEISYLLQSDEATKRYYPYEFELEVSYTLTDRTLLQVVTVRSLQNDLPFTLGFHPGFNLPLDHKSDASDYELYFDQVESPQVIHTPEGLLDGSCHTFFYNKQAIALSPALFTEGSICLTKLNSKTITLQRKDLSGHKVRVELASYPYVLLWGAPKGKAPKFVCIEPWLGLPDSIDGHGEFSSKKDLMHLPYKDEYTCRLRMELV